MHLTPREKLRQIVQKYGTDIIHDARRCEALLRDLCGSYKKEIFALSSAVREGIPHELLTSGRGVPIQSLLGRHSKRLHEDVGISEELCEWAVETWAYALGVVPLNGLRPETRCPSCDVKMQIPAKLRGRPARCPRCSAALSVGSDGTPAVRSPPKLTPDTRSVDAWPPPVRTPEPNVIDAEIVMTPSESAEDVFRQVVWRVIATGGDLLAHASYLERARVSLGLSALAAHEIINQATLASELAERAAEAPPHLIASFVAPGSSADLNVPAVAYHAKRGRDRSKPPAFALLIAGVLTVGWAVLMLGQLSSAPTSMTDESKTGLVIISLVWIGSGAAMSIGGGAMASSQYYVFAVAGTVAAFIASGVLICGCSPLFILDFPIGIWAAVVLADRDVRLSFRS